jgi:hypothetical protein
MPIDRSARRKDAALAPRQPIFGAGREGIRNKRAEIDAP